MIANPPDWHSKTPRAGEPVEVHGEPLQHPVGFRHWHRPASTGQLEMFPVDILGSKPHDA